ncbi:MAG: UvrD-helicase domain-containing protein [Ignavibacteriaceae bacterium]|nr:UvrD-helicase domain-containing protein [Ignavibacteriaceae bacterium]
MLTSHQNEALDYSHHISLTANAGSGKTLVLTNRFINIALRPDISLREIVAITFTDQAAAELQEKISRRVESEIEAAEDRKQKARLKSLRQQLSSANISTIHSFCISLLRRYPVEAGLDAGFAAIDKNQTNELILLSVEAMIKEAFADVRSVDKLKEVVRILGSLNNLKKQIINLIQNRKNFLDLYDRVYKTGYDQILDFYKKTKNENADIWAGIIKNEYFPIMAEVNQYVRCNNPKAKAVTDIDKNIKALRSAGASECILGFIRLTETMLTEKGEFRKNYLGEALFTSEIKSIHTLRVALSSAVPGDDEDKLEKLSEFSLTICRLFDSALRQYEKRKRGHGYLDFEDILLYTQRVLKIESVLEDLADRYKYIMIDEYQDTNDLQYEIFLPILKELQNGNLFVVGDDKQSIYMFRDAELKVFEKTKELISANNGKILSLPESFRMSPPLAFFNNYVFEHILQNPDKNFNEVGHQHIICAKQTDIEGGVEFLIPQWSSDEKAPPTAQKTEILAALTAKWIINFLGREEITGKFSYKNIAILCRRRNKFPALEKQLALQGIPYTIVGGTGYFQRQLILDFYNLFSFLISRENDHALAALLRSPFFMIPDTTLFKITKSPGNSLWDKAAFLANTDRELSFALKKLQIYISLSLSSGALSVIRMICRDTGYLAVIASRRNGEQEYQNFRKFITLTTNFFSVGKRNLYDFVTYLKEAVDNIEDEAQAELVEEDDKVKIMTIHQAKGLEFEAVLLFDLNETYNTHSLKKGEVILDKEFGILTKLPVQNNYTGEYSAPSVANFSSLKNSRKLLAEHKRLLYVACTRAKNYLAIAAFNRLPERNSYFSLLCDGLQSTTGVFDNMTISGELEMLVDIERDRIEKKNITLDFKLFSGAEDVEKQPFHQEIIARKSDYESSIPDKQSGEIISATIYAVYKSCPVKYYLTYRLGYGDILDQFELMKKEKSDTVLINRDDEIVFPEPKVLGNLMHRILEKKPVDLTDETLRSIIISELSLEHSPAPQLERYIKELAGNVHSSQVFSRISSSDNVFNEYSLSVKAGDFVLFGRLDKLVLAQDRALIIDYKTGDLTGDDEKIRFYTDQLRFYAFIVGRIYPLIENFELILLPVKKPDSPVIVQVNRKDIDGIGAEVKGIIEDIRSDNFVKNTLHCKFCRYYQKNNCAYP